MDGLVVYDSTLDEKSWKRAAVFELHVPRDGAEHQLLVVAENDNAHPAIQLNCPSLGLRTDTSWEASADGLHWVSVAPVDRPVELPIWNDTDTVFAAVLKTLPWQGGICLLVGAGYLLLRYRPALRRILTASNLRWILLAGWVVLAVNNIGKLPERHGFDVLDHVEYVRFIITNRHLPLANDGWQMFQPPFFYIVSAILTPLAAFVDDSLERGLRLVPLICGALQLQIVYRTMRLSFPGKNQLQCIGFLIGGFLPLNIYMSQAVGNEPMFAVLTSTLLAQCVTMLRIPPMHWRSYLWLGILLGLALLTKVTGFLLLPIVTLVIIVSCRTLQVGMRLSLMRLLVTLGSAFLLSGWFYLRNWLSLGRPLITGWDRDTVIQWWQDPGYRTPEDLFRFGFSLKTPVLAAVRGFWDSLYSSFWADGMLSGVIGYPPWNYSFMFPVLWFGIPLTLAIIAGGIVRVPAESAGARSIALCSVLTFLLALLSLYVQIPIYVAAKASYTLGITPCYGILAAAGLRPIIEWKSGRVVVTGFLAVFTLFSYLAFFVV